MNSSLRQIHQVRDKLEYEVPKYLLRGCEEQKAEVVRMREQRFQEDVRKGRILPI